MATDTVQDATMRVRERIYQSGGYEVLGETYLLPSWWRLQHSLRPQQEAALAGSAPSGRLYKICADGDLDNGRRPNLGRFFNIYPYMRGWL